MISVSEAGGATLDWKCCEEGVVLEDEVLETDEVSLRAESIDRRGSGDWLADRVDDFVVVADDNKDGRC